MVSEENIAGKHQDFVINELLIQNYHELFCPLMEEFLEILDHDIFL